VRPSRFRRSSSAAPVPFEYSVMSAMTSSFLRSAGRLLPANEKPRMISAGC
jgi:hypothetical protein